MSAPERPDPLEAARAFVEAHFPTCEAAFLGGSVVRGEGTPTSDLDIVILIERPDAPFRESFRFQGWPIEAFVHTRHSYRDFFKENAERRRPTLPMLCSEGILLRDETGLGRRIKAEGEQLLARGPAPLTWQETVAARYRLTDQLDDLRGAPTWEEAVLVAAELVGGAVDLLLAHHGQWTGQGKWLLRALRRWDEATATQLRAALRALYQREERAPLIAFVEAALAPVGGPLFEGYMANPAGIQRPAPPPADA